ncbi:MAG: hypothetical protein ACXVGQ_05200, partial [Mycobacteriaceae bacterium]
SREVGLADARIAREALVGAGSLLICAFVALAIVRCRAGASSKQSCAAAHTDARYWANARAGRFG